MKEHGPEGKKAAIRVVPPLGTPAETGITGPLSNENPLTHGTHASIIGEFRRIGFGGQDITSLEDLVTWHSFVREFDMGGMQPERVVGRRNFLRDVDAEAGVRTEIDTVVYNAHAQKADMLEGGQRPKARMLMVVWPEPRDVLADEGVVRIDTVVTDADEVRFNVIPDVTVLLDNEDHNTAFQNEVDRWGFGIQLHPGNNDQEGVLDQSQGEKFAERLRTFGDEHSSDSESLE